MQEPGVISEFSNLPVRVRIQGQNPFFLSICFSTNPAIINVRTRKDEVLHTYGASPKTAKQHLTNVFQILLHSKGYDGATLQFEVPFHPMLEMPVSDLKNTMPLIQTMMDAYF